MSENVTAAPAAEATTDTPVVQVVETPVAETEAPKVLNKNDARKEAILSARERVFGKTEPDRPRDASGKYTASTEAAQTPATGILAETEAATTQPDVIRIELPADHPLREQGRTFVTAHKDEELAVRALLNNPVRQKEVETYRQQLAVANQEAARLRAETLALREQRTQAMSNPEIAETYAALLEVNPAVAEAYRKGVELDLEKAVGEKQTEADRQLLERQGEEGARAFSQDAVQRAQSLGIENWWLQQNFQKEMAAYGWRVSQNLARWDVSEALDHLKVAYLRHPTVEAHYRTLSAAQQQQRAAEIARQAEAAALERARTEEAQRLQQAAQRRNTMNPLGSVATVNTGVRTNAEATVDLSTMGPRELKNHLRSQVIQNARAY